MFATDSRAIEYFLFLHHLSFVTSSFSSRQIFILFPCSFSHICYSILEYQECIFLANIERIFVLVYNSITSEIELIKWMSKQLFSWRFFGIIDYLLYRWQWKSATFIFQVVKQRALNIKYWGSFYMFGLTWSIAYASYPLRKRWLGIWQMIWVKSSLKH